ncbi:7 transmembrane receptor [Aphelenchoides fujianensis]|nr:7 transmembrane receptor [Aphelenchoides fujianensis]
MLSTFDEHSNASVTLAARPWTSNASADENACTFKKWAEQPNQPGFFRIFTIICVLTILVVLVVLGNALVIAAVIMRRRLRSATGLLILSLAVADLLVGLVILPFSIANEVLHSYWVFGAKWCTIWLSVDIWLCTASIYNLVAISIDRYIAIIKPLNYPMLVTKFRARCIVAAVWVVSFIICLPSFVLASSEKQKGMGKESCRCTPANSGMAYIVFSASSSFYIPMIVVIFVYVRIYIAACAATKSVYSGMMQVTATANKNPKNLLMQNPSALSRPENAPILRVHRGSTVKNTPMELSRQAKQNAANSNTLGGGLPAANHTPTSTPAVFAHMNGSTGSLQYVKRQERRHSQEERLRRNGGVEKSTESASSTPPAAHGSGSMSRLRAGTELEKSPLVRRSIGDIQQTSEGSIVTEELRMRAIGRPNGLSPRDERQSSADVQPPEVVETIENSDDLPSEETDDEAAALHRERSDSPLPTEPLNPPHNSPAHSTSTAALPSNGLPTPAGGMVGFLHPNSAGGACGEKKPTKKRIYGADVWNRIMRRGPRKKAGCAYEKRLSLEIKAAKTVAIVTGCFIFCWLGFSIVYGFSIETNEVVWSVIFWLGYLNSALNPVIYTVFNREFRTCFKRLLTCNHLIFATRTNHQNMYNSYNSTLRPGKPMAGYSSVVSQPTVYAPPAGRSTPPTLNPPSSES